jgi:quercetin dioxygenase-like cupin family protein
LQQKNKQTPFNFAQANKLVDLIAYQKGSVVSRTIIDKPAGTVTLFAFDQDQGLSEHSAPFDALVYLVDGESDITIAGVMHRVKAGQMIILPANIPHALKAVAAFKMLLTMIKA